MNCTERLEKLEKTVEELHQWRDKQDGARVTPPTPEYPRPLTWPDVKEGAVVVGGSAIETLITAANRDKHEWSGIYEDGDLTEKRTGIAGYKLLRPAPPLFEQLRIGDGVKLACGAVWYVRSIDACGRRWHGAKHRAHSLQIQPLGERLPFAESDLDGAKIVPDWPEVER
jgi:hypothetical protein